MTASPSLPTIASTRLIVGMEVHVELATRSKMFTRVANVAHPDHYDAPPNSLIDPVVLALPGALPVMNKRAVEMSIMVGLALNCTIARFSKWDRKHYFYPDLPKGYQISQYDLPLCGDGALDIPAVSPEIDGETRRIGIIRAHLEEDAGKLSHELPGGKPYEGSLVDLNRAGTPLLEIVTEPDFDCADDAVTFGRELRNICRFLGVTEGDMQRGHMRFEPNINVVIETDDGREYITPIVEIKNLNSFKALKNSIEHERERQVQAWREDGIVMGPGEKTTRGWDDDRRVTFLQRSKEDAHDYRYFPDPDLLPVRVSEEWIDEIRATLPELPLIRRARYRDQYGLPEVDASALTEDRDVCLYYESCIEAYHGLIGSAVPVEHAGHAIGKLLLNAGAKRANERECLINELGIAPAQVAQLVKLRDEDVVGSSAADELFGYLCETDDDALAVAEAKGLVQIRDEDQLAKWCDDAIAAHPQAADDVRGGKGAAIGRLMGHIMQASRGRADAKQVQAALRERLGEGRD